MNVERRAEKLALFALHDGEDAEDIAEAFKEVAEKYEKISDPFGGDSRELDLDPDTTLEDLIEIESETAELFGLAERLESMAEDDDPEP